MMVYKKKRYVGSYVSDEEAARIYDQYSIAIFGIKAQPNFSYTKQQVEQILQSADYWTILIFNPLKQSPMPIIFEFVRLFVS